MNEQNSIPQIPPHSTAKILLATVIAMVVAGIILVVAVLPAEYGIDPLGTGKALGLSNLAATSEKPAAAPTGAYAEATIAPVLGPPAPGGSKWGAAAPHLMGAFIPQAKRYKIDSRTITLEVGEGMEIKYNLKKGAGLIYSWTATAKLPYEFHGAPDVKPAGMGVDYFESYELNDKEGKDQFHGTFIAPFAGIHGWFWENTSGHEVTLNLVSAGYYDWIMENRHDKQTALDPKDPQ